MQFRPAMLPSSSTRVSNESNHDHQTLAPLARYLANRRNSADFHNGGQFHQKDANREQFDPQQAVILQPSPQSHLSKYHPQMASATRIEAAGPPSNPSEIAQAIASIIESSDSLESIPLLINNEIYNKRSLISALDGFQIQLYGHDSLEVDFILNPRTCCVHLPLGSLPSTLDRLIQKAMSLALRFEHLIFVFALYPAESRRTATTIPPNPWSEAVQQAYLNFKGRLQRRIAMELLSTHQGSTSHQVNVYLSDSSMTLAALLRLHLEQSRMPPGPSEFSEWTTAFVGGSSDWLATGLKEVSI